MQWIIIVLEEQVKIFYNSGTVLCVKCIGRPCPQHENSSKLTIKCHMVFWEMLILNIFLLKCNSITV